MRKIHLTNAAQLNARVVLDGIPKVPAPTLELPTGPAHFSRYIAATPAGLNEALAAEFGADYGQALIDGDPETDIEIVGRAVGPIDVVYLSASGDVLHVSPQVLEVVEGPDGKEVERREPANTPANVADEVPVRWTGKKIKKSAAIRRYVFRRTLQVRHVDGASYEFLHAMAQNLADENALMLVRGGPGGKEPLILQENGTPYHGFLEGRVDGRRYQLLLHLSNMPLKAPPKPEAP
jgi:hypothetical protein